MNKLKDLCEDCSFRNVCKVNKEYKYLQEKLDIAVKDLETVVNACDMRLPKKSGISYVRPEHMFIDSIRNKAQEAIVKIKEIK